MAEITSFNYLSGVHCCRRPTLSFKPFVTSLIIVGEHERVVELLNNIARDHWVPTEHAFDSGGCFVAILFARARVAVVDGAAMQSVRPAVAPVGSDVASLGTGLLSGLGQRCLGG